MAIFTHVTVGTNDLARARQFYDAVLAPLGYRRIQDLVRASDKRVQGGTPWPFSRMSRSARTISPGRGSFMMRCWRRSAIGGSRIWFVRRISAFREEHHGHFHACHGRHERSRPGAAVL